MNRMKRYAAGLGTALVLSLGINATVAAEAPTGAKNFAASGMPMHPKGFERLSRHLELTETQQEQIQAILDSARPELHALHQQIREQYRTIGEHTQSGFDETAVRSEAEKLGELVAEATVLGARVRATVQEVLTDEQKAKLSERRHHRPGPRHHRPGPRHHRGHNAE
ncbi:Spy/CpxP family protein refolding chaperone [Alkalilimnicola ehrlichii]|nr:Spy/CpxP family protein refolding chaperone [Alkalilimnicola ehrlichii]